MNFMSLQVISFIISTAYFINLMMPLGLFHRPQLYQDLFNYCYFTETTTQPIVDIVQYNGNSLIAVNTNGGFYLIRTQPKVEVQEIVVLNYPYHLQKIKGLSLADKMLYVLTETSIEVFNIEIFDDKELYYHSSFILPQSVKGLIIDMSKFEDRFYLLEQYAYPESPYLNLFVAFFQFKSTYLVECGVVEDQQIGDCRYLYESAGVMGSGLSIMNGSLYVADALAQQIKVFELEGNGLKPVTEIDIRGSPFRIVQIDDALYISVVPKMIENIKIFIEKYIFGKLDDKTKQYIQVLELRNGKELKQVLTTNEGIRGLSVSAQIGNLLILGSWVEKQIAVCKYVE